MSRWLLVRTAERTVALPADRVQELVSVTAPHAVPGVIAAVRGVAPLRGRLVSLVHLGAAIGGAAPPPAVGTTGVAVRIRDRPVVLEVDEASELASAPETPLPAGWQGRWATGAVRQAASLVPILDFDWLAEQLAAGDGSARL